MFEIPRSLPIVLLALSLTSACGLRRSRAAPATVNPAAEAPVAEVITPVTNRAQRPVSESFSAHLAKHPDLTHSGLLRELRLGDGADRPLSFDPTKVPYYDAIATKLQLTKAERALYRASGVVGVDHQQRYSMASAYFAIYARELPLLITSDSILHALHRSYDGILKELETSMLLPAVTELLARVHAELGRHAASLKGEALSASARDVDIYLTVARSLLAGAGVDADAATRRPAPAQVSRADADAGPEAVVLSKLGNDKPVAALLALVSSLDMQTPDGEYTSLNGGRRPVDYSQFRPRGHYTESEELERYFRALMWMGRADLGFALAAPDPRAGLQIDVAREQRSAALLSWLLKASQGAGTLQAVNDIVDFMVGSSDALTPGQMALAVDRARLTGLADLGSTEAIARIERELTALRPSSPRIRSQVLIGATEDSPPVRPSLVWQLFGQRFILDSFVLSQVVYDAITFKGEKVERMMPSGLDVMAALGNDEAVRLLAPDLGRYPYAANLLAARRVVAERAPDSWRQNLYDLWLGALRTLDDTPPPGAAFPEVMRRQPWRRKQLQTQLGSWAELRHDTILYSAQSYTSFPECGYPEGFVEPYPALFAGLGFFAREGARLLARASVSLADPQQARTASYVRGQQVRFLQNFAGTMKRLETMARKELAAQPFNEEERQFLKATIDMRGGGSGPPGYDGWYPRLIYGDEPAKWKPSVADVHTDPDSRSALEVAVGDVNFLVVAVDNRGDRAAYVGPAYSYYEFRRPVTKRLNDLEWQAMINGGATPGRPPWTDAFQAPPVRRTLDRATNQR